MILRRVISHVRNQEWTAVFLDFVIVVVGVFVGLQVSNWSAERADAREAAAYRQRLVADVRAEREAVDARVAYYRDVRAHGGAALAVLDGAAGAPAAAFLVDVYQATQEWPYNPARPTYEEMVSAGQGRLIPDPALRSRLAVYYGQLDEFVVPWNERTVYREAVRSALPLGLQVRIHEACEAVVVDENGASIIEEAVGPCVVPMTPAELARGVAAVTSVADLPRLLTRHLSVVDEKLRNFDDRQEQTAVMLTHLGEAP